MDRLNDFALNMLDWICTFWTWIIDRNGQHTINYVNSWVKWSNLFPLFSLFCIISRTVFACNCNALSAKIKPTAIQVGRTSFLCNIVNHTKTFFKFVCFVKGLFHLCILFFRLFDVHSNWIFLYFDSYTKYEAYSRWRPQKWWCMRTRHLNLTVVLNWTCTISSVDHVMLNQTQERRLNHCYL